MNLQTPRDRLNSDSHREDRRRFLQSLLTAGLVSGFPFRSAGQETAEAVADSLVATGTRGAVATVHPEASRAAMAAFTQGGNAVDAALAASLMLSVVDGFNSGLGGGCLVMLRLADGTLKAIDGRETAPGLAQPEMFYRNGQPDPQLSRMGPLAAGVPGLLAALDLLSRQYGVIEWQSSLQRAAEVAEDGFLIDENYAARMSSVAGQLRKFPESARVLLNEAGGPRKAGERLRQPDLANTLRQIAEQGVEWFYEGEFAERVERFMRQEDGLLRAEDFAAYESQPRKPIQSTYRQRTVYGFPPPSSGGVHIAQMLGMLSHFEVQRIYSESAAGWRHLLIEAMKRAMADRAYWLGDADFAQVPRGLIDPDYLRKRASSIDLSRATPVSGHGQPPRAGIDLFGRGGHTTHLTTADAEGNVVAITQTINTTFGCKMIVPGTGVVLNNELDDFSIAPGVRNAFGLLGSDANLIAPGKRPLSSMSPTIVVDNGNQPVLACGAAGGPKIITTVLQILSRVLDLKQSIDEAIAAPRVHHQWSPDQAVCERATRSEIVAKLRDLGHNVSLISSAAVAQGLTITDGGIVVASDPRVPSSAMAL